MAPAAGTLPSTAERIRSAAVRAQALLAVPGAGPVTAPICHLLDDGSVAVAVPTDAGTGGDDTQALLELTDHAPLRLRERVRALVWIRGRLRRVAAPDVPALLDQIAAADPNPALLQVDSPRSPRPHDGYALLRLTLESAVLADSSGAESVPLADLLAARPDPLSAVEACWLHHLDTTHPEVVARLASRLPAQLRRGRARPLGIDRYGIWLRMEDSGGDHDIRLAFTRPVDDVAGLNRAVRALMGCPFLNGLQARRG